MNPLAGVIVVVLCLGAFAMLLAWTTRPAEPLPGERWWLRLRRRLAQRRPSIRR